jgi:NADPH:quinone reductase
VDAGAILEVPEGLELDDAVALLADGRTAMMLVRKVGLREGETVLVEAAVGGVGTLLVQLARAAGARVVATAGGACKVEVARGAGVEIAVDYRESGWAEQVREAVGSVDVVFDGVGGDIGESAFGLLDRGGRMVRFGMASGEWARISEEAVAGRGVELIGLSQLAPEETRALTEDALAEAAAGRLRPVIGQRYPLARASDAHAAIESRATVGKTLLVT